MEDSDIYLTADIKLLILNVILSKIQVKLN